MWEVQISCNKVCSHNYTLNECQVTQFWRSIVPLSPEKIHAHEILIMYIKL
jgi:hypothetical protein